MPEKRTKKGFWGNIIGLVRDNAPEDLETAMDEMRKSLTADDGELMEPAAAPAAPAEEKPENPVEDEAPGAAPEANPLEARLARVEQMLAQLLKAAAPKPEPDALDTLEAELQGTQDDGEESEVVEAEEKENTEAASDGLALLKTMKPLVAGIKDPQQKKAASDTLAKLLRNQMGMNQQQDSGAYGTLLAVKRQKNGQTNDSTENADISELGRIWAGRNNPHYMKKEGK